MRKKITLYAADADGICASQTPSAGGTQSLLLNGALTTLNPRTGVKEWIADAPRVVSITSAGNDSGKTFSIIGIANGVPTTEAVTGANTSAATSTNLFSKITSITVSGNTAAAVTVGTTSTVSTGWIPLDIKSTTAGTSFMVTVGGTATYTVKHTLDNIQDSTITPDELAHDSLSAQTVGNDGNYAFPISAMKLNLTSFTSSTVEFAWIQTPSNQ